MASNDPKPLELRCVNWPTDSQTKKARKFGEGFTWTCYICAEQKVLAQGKGRYWYWKSVDELKDGFDG